MRHCGGCTLCCKLIPVEELHKPAGARCQHQRTGKGCAIYERRPFSCREWSCLWLIGTHGGKDLPVSRPDRTHYVLDMSPDLVRMRNNETGEIDAEFSVMQVWVDPLYPSAWKDPALLDMLNRDGVVALVRYSSSEGFAVFPPSRSADHQWHTSINNETSDAPDLERARLQMRGEFFLESTAVKRLARSSTLEPGVRAGDRTEADEVPRSGHPARHAPGSGSWVRHRSAAQPHQQPDDAEQREQTPHDLDGALR